MTDSTPTGTALTSTAPSPAAYLHAFHSAFGLHMRETPGVVDEPTAALRRALLAEEFAEVDEAAGEVAADPGALAHFAQELADLVYVTYGTALTHGIDLDAVLAEVHRANMSKLGPDGSPVRRADGKVMKGPHYRAPDIAAVLRARGWEPGEAGQ
ncbi:MULTISPECIES: pyrophosphohydrolase domain-containing protein [Streptomyces]|uniref:HAD superfamily Cof-like phosphohydrolase n=1 Tax=Streptomyces evansiae TaxID=3075535 RepID=A0ABD5EB93_9ACTN|nr:MULTISPECIES: hypothetical protein [unclassified Streptomyces]ASY34187.1 hypothetical protein CAC01_17220 [Streptomyces sp. CLI2509]EGJ76472.1 hypothetical protein STTU_3683 [Streptomyces sp. Tu6071]MDT0418669.1 hypothetical protein [Streptomyces sp. DSM 41982]MDT0424554.1 hypothetical protein [Streptomyces sp. DSM 41859]MYX20467.1 hypothetical protein [Streptomyces sp. SID8380]